MAAWMVFVFFTLIIRIESNTIQATRTHIQPKPSEMLNVFRATSGINGLKELDGTTGSVRIQTVGGGVKEFFLRFQTNVKQLEEAFDGSVFDYVVKNLWDYCVKVRSLISKTDDFKSSDVESIKFEVTFDYSIVTYLFNSDRTNDRVDDILNPIYYLQTLPYTQFSNTNDAKKNIDEMMDYIINTIKLYGRDDPGDLKKSVRDECSTTQLENIRRKISNLSKRFRSIKVPPIMNINLLIEPKILDPSSKFIRSLLYNQKIFIKYDEFHYENNEPQYIILNWMVEPIGDTTGIQNYYYTKLVTTDPNLQTGIIYLKGRTVSRIWPVDKSSMTMKTEETLISLLKSLKKNFGLDRRSYNNAVQYHTIMVDVLMVVATKLGYRMFRGIKSIVGVACGFILSCDSLGIPFTDDLAITIRAQLLQFRFYYGKTIDVIKQRLNVVLHYAYNAIYYYTFQKESLRISSAIDKKTSVDVYLKNNCRTLGAELGIISGSRIKGKYFDEVKFKRYFFLDTTRYMYEIYDYFSSFVDYHFTHGDNDYQISNNTT